MTVEITDALARDLFYWLQNSHITVPPRRPEIVEPARESMLEELAGAMAAPGAMQDTNDETIKKQLAFIALARRGKVVLTSQEALQLKRRLAHVLCHVRSGYVTPFPVNKSKYERDLEMITRRIADAEKKE